MECRTKGPRMLKYSPEQRGGHSSFRRSFFIIICSTCSISKWVFGPSDILVCPVERHEVNWRVRLCVRGGRWQAGGCGVGEQEVFQHRGRADEGPALAKAQPTSVSSPGQQGPGQACVCTALCSEATRRAPLSPHA